MARGKRRLFEIVPWWANIPLLLFGVIGSKLNILGMAEPLIDGWPAPGTLIILCSLTGVLLFLARIVLLWLLNVGLPRNPDGSRKLDL